MPETIGSVLDATRRAQHMSAPTLYEGIMDQATFLAVINGSESPTPQQIMAFTTRLKLDVAPLTFSKYYPISKDKVVNQTVKRLLSARDWVGLSKFLSTLADDSRTPTQNSAFALYHAISVFFTGDAAVARTLLENSLANPAGGVHLKYLSQAALAYIAAQGGRKVVATRYRHYLVQSLKKPVPDLDVSTVYLLLALADVTFDQTAPALPLIQTGISIATASHQLVIAWRLIDLWAQLLLPDATTNRAALRLGCYLNDSLAELSQKFAPLPQPETLEGPTTAAKKHAPKRKKAKTSTRTADAIAYQEKIAQTMKLMAQVRAKTKPLVVKEFKNVADPH